MNVIVNDRGGNECRMSPADAFAELTVETDNGVIRVLIGVQGDGAAAIVDALLECAEERRKRPALVDLAPLA